jgi:RecA-family ATPase
MSLPVLPAAKLPSHTPDQRWLVDQLWGAEAVGIIGGEPKCCKSFLALDLAVSVASATNCLGRFRVAHPARVLLLSVTTKVDGIVGGSDRVW